jgi:hypothetical protein
MSVVSPVGTAFSKVGQRIIILGVTVGSAESGRLFKCYFLALRYCEQRVAVPILQDEAPAVIGLRRSRGTGSGGASLRGWTFVVDIAVAS